MAVFDRIKGTRMTIKLSTTTRGNGKVFTLIETDLVGASWEASAVTKGNDKVPAKVHLLDDGTPVLVVAGLAVDQSVSVTARDTNGAIIGQARHTVSARGAALASKANTLLKNPRVAALRNCDQDASTTELAVYALRLIPKGTECDLLHALVFFAVVDPAQEPPAVELEVLDDRGRSAVLGEPVLLGDLVEEFPDYPGVYYRAVQYSIPITHEMGWFCLSVSCPEAGIDPNFICMQPHDMFGLLNFWHTIPFGFEGADPNYEAWLKSTRANATDLEIQRRDQATLPIRPKFSVVVPLYHTPIDFFHDMADSVLGQTYPNFELILVNSTPEDADLAQAVTELAAADERVRVVTLDQNYGITENTNAGIDVATGDFVSFFDHDDLLEPDLLYWYVRGINEYPETDLLYCDEDKLLDGHYVEPFYKPDWSVLFLETNNYVCHLLTVRKSVIDALPRPTDVYDGAQDHRLALAAGELARNVYHARRMLYHWRIHSASTAGDGAAKPESLVAGRRAIEEHFERLGIPARADDLPNSPHCYVPVYTPDALPSVSAVVSPGSEEQVRRTVESLEALGWDNLQILTSDPVAERNEVSTSFARAVEGATGELLVLLAAGATVREAASFEQLLACATRPDVAIACPKTVFPDGTNHGNGLAFHDRSILHMNRYFYQDLNADRAITVLPHDVSAGSGHVVALTRSTYDELEGLTEGLPQTIWGVDLCLKARVRGLRIAQHSPSRIEFGFVRNDLTLDMESTALQSESDRSYLLRTYPEVLSLPDHYYKPLL